MQNIHGKALGSLAPNTGKFGKFVNKGIKSGRSITHGVLLTEVQVFKDIRRIDHSAGYFGYLLLCKSG